MVATGNPCKGTYPPQISDNLSSDRSTSRGWSVFGLQVHQLLKNVSCTIICTHVVRIMYSVVRWKQSAFACM